jgi:phage terminase large subunit-like protein
VATKKRAAHASPGKAKRAETRGERNCRWIETHCLIPEGKDVGKPVKLREWQKRDICKIYDNPNGTRTAILSFAKKNAKTSLSAFLLLLHLAGYEAIPNTQLVSTAQSRDQAAVLFDLAAKVVRQSPTLAPVINIKDTIKHLACPDLGTLYKALSAEAKTAHGKSPVFAVHDELGQVRGPTSQLFNAIENAMGAHDRPLSVVISTQAPTDSDLLSILIDDAIAGHDPRVVLSLYTAPMSLDPFSDEAIKAANPAFGDFLNATEVRKQAADAKRMPSQESLYRNYTLNQRVEASSPFVSRSLWQSCAGDLKPIEDVAVYGALDLSAVNDLTAKVYIGKVDGIWQVHPTFWLPREGLEDKARKDRVPYDVWYQQGHLLAAPGKSVDYEYVARILWEDFGRLDIKKIAFDRWGFKHLKPWLLKAGFDEDQVEGDNAIFVEFGQGFQSMSPALRDLEGEILNGRIAHGGHPVLTNCAGNAVVATDPSGNRKLAKDKSAGRIDGLVALAMAMGVAPLTEAEGSVYTADRGLLVFGT